MAREEKQMTMTPNKIGMIGIGRMGHGIATNLVSKGFDLRFLDHPGNQPAGDLVKAGAVSCTSIAEVVAGRDLVILCVTGSAEVENILFGASDNGTDPGKGGLAEASAKGLVVMDCSTCLPSETRRFAERLAPLGITLFDAAMTRTPAESAAGRLNLILGGDADTIAGAMPVMRAFAEVITHAGGTGMGQEAKLLHNFVSLGFSAVLAEAAGRARAAQIDQDAFLEIIGKGGGGGVVFDRFVPYLKHGNTDSFRFTLANSIKDLGYFGEMIRATESSSLSSAIRDLYSRAAADLGPEATVPEMTGTVARDIRQDQG